MNNRLSLMTGIFWKQDFLDIINRLIDAGFKTFEIWGHETHFKINDEKYVETVKKIAENKNIKFSGLHLPSKQPYDIDNTDKIKRDNAVNIIIELIPVFKKLNIPFLIIHPGQETQQDKESQKNNALSSLTLIGREFKKYNLKIALENPLPHHLGGTLEDYRFFIDNLDKQVFGWCFDSSHANLSQSGYKIFLENFRNRLIHTHLSDNNGKFDDHFLPGKGIINWIEIFKIINESNYTGYYNFEIMFEELNPDLTKIFTNLNNLIKDFTK